MTQNTPPKLAAWLLKHLGCSADNDALLGDLAERYRRGKTAAWYWKQVVVAIAVGACTSVHGHKMLGFATGTLVSLTFVVGNIARGDPHLVSLFPYIVDMLVAPAVIFLAVRSWQRHGAGRAEIAHAARHSAFIAALIFAGVFLSFSWWWFPSPRRPRTVEDLLFSLAIVAGAGVFMFLDMMTGYMAARLTLRRRINRTQT